MNTETTSTLNELGREIAEGWIEADPQTPPKRDYDFGAAGDWDLIKSTCAELGVDFDDDHAEVIRAVRDGYQTRVDEEPIETSVALLVLAVVESELTPVIVSNADPIALDVTGKADHDATASAEEAAADLETTPAEIKAAVIAAHPPAADWDWSDAWGQ